MRGPFSSSQSFKIFSLEWLPQLLGAYTLARISLEYLFFTCRLIEIFELGINPLLFPVVVASGYENEIIMAAEFCSYHTIENKQVWYLVLPLPYISTCWMYNILNCFQVINLDA
jgi:hypothetical protein